MAALLLHGDNQFQSRQRLGQLIDEYTQRGYLVKRLEAAKVSEAELTTTLSAQNLFQEPTLVVIEGLHSLQTSNRKKKLILLITEIIPRLESEQKALVLWETRSLTKTMLKPFLAAGAEAQEFPVSQMLFKWLEQLSPQPTAKPNLLKTFQTVLDQENEFLVLTMLARQIRLLLQVKAGEEPSVPPFLKSKLARQAGLFTFEKLLEVHQKLFFIDRRSKSSGHHLNLKQELDLLLITL